MVNGMQRHATAGLEVVLLLAVLSVSDLCLTGLEAGAHVSCSLVKLTFHLLLQRHQFL